MHHYLKDIERAVIVGAGPGGAALATLLGRAGIRIAMLHEPKRPELIVGESLVPATIPVLRALGVEREVAEFSTYKPGATFFVRPEEPLKIVFCPRGSTYAYNVPRAQFDDTVLGAAVRTRGVSLMQESGKLTYRASTDTFSLEEEQLARVRDILGGEPQLFVDASGRAREFAKTSELRSVRGKRNDCVIFAHHDRCELENEGHIHINRLSRGWSWRIPLPDRVSVGVVMPAAEWRAFGDTPEERYDEYLRTEPILAAATRTSQRISSVAVYTNYQLIGERFSGTNWVLVGDAAGFVDPIFSSGLDLTLNGAMRCAKAVLRGGPRAFDEYEREQRRNILAWQLLAESFYDGRLFGLIRASSLWRNTPPWNHVIPHAERHLVRAIAGMLPFDSLRFRVASSVLRSGFGQRYGHRFAVQ